MTQTHPISTDSRRLLWLALFAMIGLLACGSPTNPGSPVDVVDPPDLAPPPTPDVPDDVPIGEDTPQNTCEPTTTGLAPAYCPCEENGECESGYCVESSQGKVCTETCVTECPDGWSCELVSGTGSDTIFLCLPKPLSIDGYLLGDGFALLSDNGEFFLHHTLGAPRIHGTSSNSSFTLTSGLPQGGL